MAEGSLGQAGAVRDAMLDLATGAACLGCARPGRVLCPACRALLTPTPRQTMPQPPPPGLLAVFTASDYDGVMRDLVLAHKERGLHGLAVPLGQVLAHVVLGAARSVLDDTIHTPVSLVPVPSHPSVVRGRGHDPVLRIARRAAHELRRRGTPAGVRRLLGVVGRPQDQAGLGAVERHANLTGRFQGRPARSSDLSAVVIVDDVITTGATLREAQRALELVGWSPQAAVTLAATQRRRGLPESPPDG